MVMDKGDPWDGRTGSARQPRRVLTLEPTGQLSVGMDLGHAAQNVFLQAVSLELGTTQVVKFDDGDISDVVGLTDEETPLYLIPVGRYGS